MVKKRKLSTPSRPTHKPAAEQQPAAAAVKDEPIHDEPINEFPEEQPTDYPIKEECLPDDETEPPAIPDPSSTTTAPTDGGEVLAGDGSAAADPEDNDPASVEKLLEPFPKDHLVELLRDAAVRHPDVLEQVIRTADADPAHRKIFVHGLGWETTAETLVSAFLQYGEIEDCKAVTDRITGKSKGYGFILFKHRSAAQRALREPQKKIGSRITACQLASAGPVAPVPPPAPPVSEYTQRKIYVSNVSAEMDPQKVLQFFSRYGEIEEGPLGLDKATGKPKGFCLFVYKAVESAKKALAEPHKDFEGHVLHCQKAIDGPKSHKLGFQFQQGGAQSPMVPGPVGSNAGFIGGMGNHVPAPATVGGLNPALGQALTALLATQAAGFGLTNLLGGSAVVNTGGYNMQGGYGNQAAAVGGDMNPSVMGGYGAPAATQGGYGNAQMAQGSSGRTQKGRGYRGGRAPYMRH